MVSRRSGFDPRHGTRHAIRCKNLALNIRDCESLCLSDETLMLNAHLPTGSRQLAISPTADWELAFVGRCVLNADPIVGANRRYSADSKFESA